MTARSIYATRRWMDHVRPRQLRREPLCRLCKARGHIVQATQVDHVVRLEEGGAPWDPSNLESLCHSCHSQKTAAERGGRPMRGCDASGRPTDPRHPWNRASPESDA